MACVDDNLTPSEILGIDHNFRWQMEDFDVVSDSMHNAELGIALLGQIAQPKGKINWELGARKFARGMARENNKEVLDRFVHVAFARQGWMVPNQYWNLAFWPPWPLWESTICIMGKILFFREQLAERTHNVC